MVRFFLKIFLTIFILAVFSIIFLSYYGIETGKFDSLIKEKANKVNRYVKLEFKKTKILINPTELNLVVKLQNPKVLVKKSEIILSKIYLFLPLKSFFTSSFLLKKAEVAFSKNDVKDVEKISNIFLPKFFSKQINKIFETGNLEGEFVIPFNADGSVGQNYQFEVKLFNANLNINKDFQIKNLSTEVKYYYQTDKDKDKKINILINQGSIFGLDLKKSSIIINFKDNKKIIKSSIKTTGTSKYPEIKKFSSLLGLDLSYVKNLEVESDLETSIQLSLNNKFKITDNKFSIYGKINNLSLEHKNFKDIREFFPAYNSKIILKETEIKIENSAKNSKLTGLVKFDNKFEEFSIKFSGLSDKNFDTQGKVSLYDLSLQIPQLNYSKDQNTKANLDFHIKGTKKGYDINRLIYSSEKSKIELDKIEINKKFEISDIRNIKVKTLSNNIRNNDFHIGKHLIEKNTLLIKGELFDVEPLLKSIYKSGDKKIFSKDFNNEIKANLDKIITGTNDNVSNFGMIASIKKGSYNKLSLKGNFSENEIVEMSIYQVDGNKKTLQVISDRARPFVMNFDFIKGFEGGKLEYESVISKESSHSNLLISDFKVSKVPALAKLLTLASFQGIADTLSGEGIRFVSFEMKSNSEGNVLNIEDALAMGPAISILLDGYVEKGQVVSLRGTLVPATKLNSIIASIPLVGDILVGKKTGEGVVGVSFKMKGPPKNIKTTVNPIKTLTPRFIVRAIENIKKKKKEEVK